MAKKPTPKKKTVKKNKEPPKALYWSVDEIRCGESEGYLSPTKAHVTSPSVFLKVIGVFTTVDGKVFKEVPLNQNIDIDEILDDLQDQIDDW